MTAKVKQSFDAAIAGLLSTPEEEVTDRVVVAVPNSVRQVVLTIGQLFNLVRNKKLKRALVQRNDELRREQGRAKHVTKNFHIAHTGLALCWHKGQWYLVDGSHRVGHWFESTGAHVPSHVMVTAFFPQTEQGYISLYEAFDSNKAAKSKRDWLFSYIRYLEAEEKVSSKMVTSGSFVTAFNNLAGGSSHDARIECMRKYLPAVLLLDQHQFESKQVPQALVLAALRLYKAVGNSDLVRQYIDGLAHAFAHGENHASAPIRRAYKQFQVGKANFGDGGLGGEKATKDLGAILEHAFVQYAKEVGVGEERLEMKAKLPSARLA